MKNFIDSPMSFTHNLSDHHNNQKVLMIRQDVDDDNELGIGAYDADDNTEVFIYLNASELDELIALLTEKRALMI